MTVPAASLKPLSTMKKRPLALALMMLGALPQTATADDDAALSISTTSIELDEVSVRAQRGDDFKSDGSTIGGKTDTPLRDIPQSVTVINRAVIAAQNATTLTEALRNVPGITLTAGEGGQIGDNVNLRGFTARTDIYLDGARDRAQYRRDTFELESIEVLKGPSSLFFGRGSTGGLRLRAEPASGHRRRDRADTERADPAQRRHPGLRHSLCVRPAG
jgi:catecholate siderophore receptor